MSTSNYGAEAGRSSGPQVSLVTRSGTNEFNGSGYWLTRRTATSSNEYFLKLTQVLANKPSEAPKLDKDIFGGSFGGPIRRNKLFFFGNYESAARKERDARRSQRPVGLDARRRAAVSVRGRVGVPGRVGSRVQLVARGAGRLVRLEPRRKSRRSIRSASGPSRAASQYFKQFPSPNDPGTDGRNLMAFRFAAPIENDFNTLISRVDYRLTDNQTLLRRASTCRTTRSTPRRSSRAGSAIRRRCTNNFGLAIGYDAVLSSNARPTASDTASRRSTRSTPASSTATTRPSGSSTRSTRRLRRSPTPPDARRTTSSTTCRGSRASTPSRSAPNLRFTPDPDDARRKLVPDRHGQPVVGGGHRPHATCRAAPSARTPGCSHAGGGQRLRRPATPTPGSTSSACCRRPRSAPTTTGTEHRCRVGTAGRARVSRRTSTSSTCRTAGACGRT